MTTQEKSNISLLFILQVALVSIMLLFIVGFAMDATYNPLYFFITLSAPAIALQQKLSILPTSFLLIIAVPYVIVCPVVSGIFCTLKSCNIKEVLVTCFASIFTAFIIHAAGFYISILPYAG
ncbi:hypothetical protein [Candidatus Uabimicrobium amorphum]|uniref:Uncharacterized protein n=1 Tax=Uabimicrobium amorphum TaxID=2596890 RepID=A0A5S9IU63_UABAM|nr:hypothetical protein [Candidatus Uabimicrobium amorphum]BBM87640.1 hypothetical protein UABAM_06052 [Candidatus Uabimicrobium amorphum]